MSEFVKLQNNLKKILDQNTSKYAFTCDGWTASNGKSYYGITLHFIDKDWNDNSLALDLVPSNGRHTGKSICSFFYQSLEFYEIEKKIQGVTVDNVAAKTTFIEELALVLDEKNIEFDAEDQHFRCFSHISTSEFKILLNF